jgi:hypothetical protein
VVRDWGVFTHAKYAKGAKEWSVGIRELVSAVAGRAYARIRHGGKKKWGEVTIQRLDKDS